MAKLSNLITALSEVTGMPSTSVEAYARRIRQAGKISTGGRGLGSADMTPQDCAHLLIAVMARTPTHAVEALKKYGSMTCASGEPGDRAKPLFDTFGVKSRHTFVHFLSRLIESARDTPLEQSLKKAFIESNLIPKKKTDNYFFTAEITVITPWDSISFSGFSQEIYWKEDHKELWIVYLPNEHWKRIKGNTAINALGDTSRGDLHQETKISQKTIDALGQLLRDT